MIEQKYFEQYANYSVKVDRYFHCVNAYTNSHSGLKEIHDTLDKTYKRMLELEETGNNTDNDIRSFLQISYFIMQKIHMDNIFSDKDSCGLGDLVYDMQIFSYVTCYCYQWNLFESFISYIVDKLSKSNKLKGDILNKLKCCKGKTKKLLDLLNDEVFENSPFDYILPEIDSNGNFVKIGYNELDTIRKRRNKFVHSVLNNSFDNENIMKLQKLYDKDMWILRLYAQNVFYQVNEL